MEYPTPPALIGKRIRVGVVAASEHTLLAWDPASQQIVLVEETPRPAVAGTIRLPSGPWSVAFAEPDSVFVNMPASGIPAVEYDMGGRRRREYADAGRGRSRDQARGFLSARGGIGILCVYMTWLPRAVLFDFDGGISKESQLGQRSGRVGSRPRLARSGRVFAHAPARMESPPSWAILCASPAEPSRKVGGSGHTQQIVILLDSGRTLSVPVEADPTGAHWHALASRRDGGLLLASSRFCAEVDALHPEMLPGNPG